MLGTTDVIPEETATFLRGGPAPAMGFAVDEGTITGPVLVCAIAGERCDETRLLLGLPELATVELDDDGQTVVRGSVLSGRIRVVEDGVTVQPMAGCLGETSPSAVPSSPDPTPLSVPLPDDARLGPCDIAFGVLFPNGSLQTIIQSIQVAAAP